MPTLTFIAEYCVLLLMHNTSHYMNNQYSVYSLMACFANKATSIQFIISNCLYSNQLKAVKLVHPATHYGFILHDQLLIPCWTQKQSTKNSHTLFHQNCQKNFSSINALYGCTHTHAHSCTHFMHVHTPLYIHVNVHSRIDMHLCHSY